MPTDPRSLLRDLGQGTWTLAVISAAAETGLLAALPATPASLAGAARLDEAIVVRMLDVLAAHGLVARGDDGAFSLAPEAAWLTSEAARNDMRSTFGQSRAFLAAARDGTLRRGWSFTDPELLQAQGRSAGGGLDAVIRQLIESLEGMKERLAQGARFLDVGTGVGAICIDFCRAYPGLRCVGIEPQDAPLAQARRNIAEADLADRIELRQLWVDDLGDEHAFDLAWIPQVFLPRDVYARALANVHRALKPGGWLLTVVGNPQPLMQLRVTLWGGDPLTPDEGLAMLREAGYSPALPVPVPPQLPIRPLVGRKPE